MLTSLLSVPPHSLSTQPGVAGVTILPTLLVQGMMSQSVLQEFGPTPPIMDVTAFWPRVLPVSVKAWVLLFTVTAISAILKSRG